MTESGIDQSLSLIILWQPTATALLCRALPQANLCWSDGIFKTLNQNKLLEMQPTKITSGFRRRVGIFLQILTENLRKNQLF